MIFVSYAREDWSFVEPLKERLEREGFEVFVDQTAIPPGAPWRKFTGRKIRRASAMLVVLSSDSVKSREVEREWNHALNHLEYIIPIRLDECEVPYGLEDLDLHEMRPGSEEDVDVLIQWLKAGAFKKPLLKRFLRLSRIVWRHGLTLMISAAVAIVLSLAALLAWKCPEKVLTAQDLLDRAEAPKTIREKGCMFYAPSVATSRVSLPSFKASLDRAESELPKVCFWCVKEGRRRAFFRKLYEARAQYYLFLSAEGGRPDLALLREALAWIDKAKEAQGGSTLGLESTHAAIQSLAGAGGEAFSSLERQIEHGKSGRLTVLEGEHNCAVAVLGQIALELARRNDGASDPVKAERLKSAESWLLPAASRDPSAFVVQATLGQVQLERENLDAAVDTLIQATTLLPGDIPTRLGLGDTYAALSESNEQEPRDRQEYCQSAVEEMSGAIPDLAVVDPRDPGRDRRLDPREPDILQLETAERALGLALLRLGDLEGAEAHLYRGIAGRSCQVGSRDREAVLHSLKFLSLIQAYKRNREALITSFEALEQCGEPKGYADRVRNGGPAALRSFQVWACPELDRLAYCASVRPSVRLAKLDR